MTHEPRIAPEVGFDGATFMVQVDDASGSYPTWDVEGFSSVRHVPGSNRTYLFLMGLGPARLDLNVWCDDRAEYDALRAKVQATGRLTLIADLQSQHGIVRHVLGVTYEDLDDVTLLGISNERFATDGEVEATLHFIRAGSAT